MTEKEKKILRNIAKELNMDGITVAATEDEIYRARNQILRKMILQLPDGEIKNFFEEIQNVLKVEQELEEIEEKRKQRTGDKNTTDAFIKSFRKVVKVYQSVKEIFDTGQHPKGIPQGIILAYQSCLDYFIRQLEMAIGVFITVVNFHGDSRGEN